MKVLFFDLDTLRADHLGCYGYGRNTSPNIDRLAKEGVKFDNYYCPNAPCLPSRASLASGKFGIETGVVGHGGTAADMRLQGESRNFRSQFGNNNLFSTFRKAGYYTASVSTFAERHSAFWFYAGFNEIYNVGKGGSESAEEVMPYACKWVKEHAHQENWVLHLNLWDSHTPYRTPKERKNEFADVPLCDNWIDEAVFQSHLKHVGPHGANEINMWDDKTDERFPKHPGKLTDLNAVKNFIDQYDCGVKYMDEQIGTLLEILREEGVLEEDICVIVTSDHGENLGELGLYGEHATADLPTCRIPMIIKWKGLQKGVVDESFHTNVDLLPTVCDLLNVKPLSDFDGQSFYSTLLTGESCGQSAVVMTQCAHVCQRSVRFGDYLYINTQHGGGHLFEEDLLFDVKSDPHELHNLAEERKDLVCQGAKLIFDWVNRQMRKSPYPVDPMWTVMKEGGPSHARGALESYAQRLKNTGRDVESFLKKYHINEE